MDILFHIANTLVMPTAIGFAYNYYKFHGREINYRALWVTMGILAVTVTLSTLQFIFPEIIPALNRNSDAIRAGELWRVITPLFIQPGGIWHCVINAVFFPFFVPLTEHFYGRGLLLIYFGASLVLQPLTFYWDTTPGGIGSVGGGASTGIYSCMGALFMYILIKRATFPKGYIWLSIAGFLGATILMFYEDGHAPSLLTGAVLAFVLCKFSRAHDRSLAQPEVH